MERFFFFFLIYTPLGQHMVKIKLFPCKSNLKTFMLSFIFRKTFLKERKTILDEK